MKIVAFAASSSTKSINKQLATYAASLLEGAQVEILDLNDYDLPLFSEDKEKEIGHPELAKELLSKIGDSDGVIISFAEHNGSYAVAYKNIFDWCLRVNPKVFQGKPLVFLSTSPGPGGARSVLAAAVNSAQYFDGDVKANLSVPSFYDNFDVESGRMKDGDINDQLVSAIQSINNQKKAA